ncbi:bcl-2-binding component 3, isoforms 3/4-like [Tiliqua scincoides]|uniref:bcl-2-binding component 3, isoforms 3/4-like n=1 Tax=Tiliqua scincoides TaxID=71010 RepID=UPI00346265D9
MGRGYPSSAPENIFPGRVTQQQQQQAPRHCPGREARGGGRRRGAAPDPSLRGSSYPAPQPIRVSGARPARARHKGRRRPSSGEARALQRSPHCHSLPPPRRPLGRPIAAVQPSPAGPGAPRAPSATAGALQPPRPGPAQAGSPPGLQGASRAPGTGGTSKARTAGRLRHDARLAPGPATWPPPRLLPGAVAGAEGAPSPP